MGCPRRLVSRLLEWMGGRESRKRKAVFGELRNGRKRAQIELEKMRPDDLAGNADVRKTRLGA